MNEYKDYLQNPSAKTHFLKYGTKSNEKRQGLLTCQFDISFDHTSFQNVIFNGAYDDKYSEIHDFICFYSQFKFEPNDENVLSIKSILDIIKQRDPNSRELVQYCFEALHVLFHSHIDPSILLLFNILSILDPYLNNSNINDIIPSLSVIKYLVLKNKCSHVLRKYDISVFRRILEMFDEIKIDNIIHTILSHFFDTIESQKIKNEIDFVTYQKFIRELFETAFYIFKKESDKFNSDKKNYKSTNLNFYLKLFYSLLGNNEGILPDLNERLASDFISPLQFFNYALNEFKRSSVSITIKILTEIIYNHFEYFNFIDIKRMSNLFYSKLADIQLLSIKFFYTLLQVTKNGNNQIDKNQIDQIQTKISQLNVFSNLFLQFKSDYLFYESKVTAIKIFDDLFNIMPKNDLYGYFDQQMIDCLCFCIDENLDCITLYSILSIFDKLFDMFDTKIKNMFAQKIKENLDQDAVDIFFKTNDINVVHMAEYFFRKICSA